MDEPLPTKKRSALMARIGSKGSAAEMTIRRYVHSMGYRYRLHRKDLPGTPDIVFPARKKVIFVHGCFWHHHDGCQYATVPKTRTGFWKEKFRKNQERDERIIGQLKKLGWSYLVVWECEVKRNRFRTKVDSFLADDINGED
jgi:DNA mismatch endonuclease (patch repair protein)